MATPKILLPYNFTTLGNKALAFANNTFGQLEEVEITLFHAYTPLPKIEVESSSVMGKLKGDLTYLNQKIMQQEAELKAVEEKLLQGGFGQNSIHIVFRPRKKDVAAEIIELVSEHKFSVIILHHKSGKASRFFTGSVFSKVVSALKDTTVCIVS